MNWALMLAAIGLSGFIGLAVPTLFFDQPFMGKWSLVGMAAGFVVGLIIHGLIRRTGYIE